jgi:hypothetical protein
MILDMSVLQLPAHRPAGIEMAFELPPEKFEEIWNRREEWTVEPGLHTTMLTVSGSSTATILHSLPRFDAISYSREYGLLKIY